VDRNTLEQSIFAGFSAGVFFEIFRFAEWIILEYNFGISLALQFFYRVILLVILIGALFWILWKRPYLLNIKKEDLIEQFRRGFFLCLGIALMISIVSLIYVVWFYAWGLPESLP
jgi:hypothetical protein